jgi:hypothetical protein
VQGIARCACMMLLASAAVSVSPDSKAMDAHPTPVDRTTSANNVASPSPIDFEEPISAVGIDHKIEAAHALEHVGNDDHVEAVLLKHCRFVTVFAELRARNLKTMARLKRCIVALLLRR